MGNELSMSLEEVLERDRLENSPLAPGFRKIFRKWNATDLWTALRRYWNEFPKKPEWLKYEDMQHILVLNEAEAMFLWDTYATQGVEMIRTTVMFMGICLYCGTNVSEKGRFLLTLFDSGGRGLVSLNELGELIFLVIETLGKPALVTVKKKPVISAYHRFIDALLDTGRSVDGFETTTKTIHDCKNTLREGENLFEDRIVGLIELRELCNYVHHTMEDSFCNAHHSAIESVKRVSPAQRITHAPTRDYNEDLMHLQEAAAKKLLEIEERKRIEAANAPVQKQESIVSEVTLDDETVTEQWMPITLLWHLAQQDVPALRHQIHRQICKSLGCMEKRVAIHFIGQGFVHLAVGGKTSSFAHDERQAVDLATQFLTQMENKKSWLRQGLLENASVHNVQTLLDLIEKVSSSRASSKKHSLQDTSQQDAANLLKDLVDLGSVDLNNTNVAPLEAQAAQSEQALESGVAPSPPVFIAQGVRLDDDVREAYFAVTKQASEDSACYKSMKAMNEGSMRIDANGILHASSDANSSVASSLVCNPAATTRVDPLYQSYDAQGSAPVDGVAHGVSVGQIDGAHRGSADSVTGAHRGSADEPRLNTADGVVFLASGSGSAGADGSEQPAAEGAAGQTQLVAGAVAGGEGAEQADASAGIEEKSEAVNEFLAEEAKIELTHEKAEAQESAELKAAESQ